MAPVPRLGRDRAIQLVEGGKLPFTFGSPHPHMMALEQDGTFRIRKLVIDPEEAMRARAESMAARGSWLPEQHYELGRPTGEIFAEAASAEELAATMKAMDWPNDW